jgi:hypothetical protein
MNGDASDHTPPAASELASGRLEWVSKTVAAQCCSRLDLASNLTGLPWDPVRADCQFGQMRIRSDACRLTGRAQSGIPETGEAARRWPSATPVTAQLNAHEQRPAPRRQTLRVYGADGDPPATVPARARLARLQATRARSEEIGKPHGQRSEPRRPGELHPQPCHPVPAPLHAGVDGSGDTGRRSSTPASCPTEYSWSMASERCPTPARRERQAARAKIEGRGKPHGRRARSHRPGQ